MDSLPQHVMDHLEGELDRIIGDRPADTVYGETLVVLPDGSISEDRRLGDESMPYLPILVGHMRSLADLGRVVFLIRQRLPQFEVSLEVDPDGHWAQYGVRRANILDANSEMREALRARLMVMQGEEQEVSVSALAEIQGDSESVQLVRQFFAEVDDPERALVILRIFFDDFFED